MRVSRDFFNRPTLVAAREVLGCRLVRLQRGRRLSGLIREAEAYVGSEDLGCHARAGRTQRNASMWGPPGHAYVYFTYGMHWMLNLVTEESGFPAAVLVRALFPVEGERLMVARRGQGKPIADGPAMLCQALGIDGGLDGHDLCDPGSEIFLEEGVRVPEEVVLQGPRVGLNSVPQPWKSLPWRFQVKHSDLGRLVAGSQFRITL
ncbi:MAG: DNA-3-methyladenine glycosylase [Acidobacteriota bacterium]